MLSWLTSGQSLAHLFRENKGEMIFLSLLSTLSSVTTNDIFSWITYKNDKVRKKTEVWCVNHGCGYDECQNWPNYERIMDLLILLLIWKYNYILNRKYPLLSKLSYRWRLTPQIRCLSYRSPMALLTQVIDIRGAYRLISQVISYNWYTYAWFDWILLLLDIG